MLIIAITTHNIPEGISGGAVFAGLLMNNSKVTLAGAFALSIGIAIQNVPEGFIVSLPVRSEKGRIKAFFIWYVFWDCGTNWRWNNNSACI